jgi:hypothetical protein
MRVPSSSPSQIRRITPAAATSKTCMVRSCSLASTKALVSITRTPTASASSYVSWVYRLASGLSFGSLSYTPSTPRLATSSASISSSSARCTAG